MTFSTRFLGLRGRFILAGCLLVSATVASSAWCALTLLRLDRVLDATLRAGQETIDLSTEVANSLEREDDALLLFLSGDVAASRRDLAAERARGDAALDRLLTRLRGGERGEQDLAAALRGRVDQYRRAGDELHMRGGRGADLERYHRVVNPLLRGAVGGCEALREANFRAIRQSGVRARNEAARGTRIVIGISALTSLAGAAVATWLARSVLGPVRELTASVDDIRGGHFDRRVRHATDDELGRLAVGFNRMAESLSEYRRSSLGELLSAKTTLESVLNALPDAVMVIGPDGALAALNPPAKAVLAAKGAGAASRLAELPLSDGDRDAVEGALRNRRPAPRTPDFGQTFNAVLDGRPRRFLLTAVPVPDYAPRRCGAVVVLDDVTEFARLDELRSELIGVASHELKSPLTTLRMNLLMLGETSDAMAPRQQELVASAVGACEELGLTIEELLDVARIEAGQLRLNLAPVDLKAVLETARRSLQTRFDDAGVRLVVDSEPGPVVVLGDPNRLGGVLVNVLTNALKYSDAGGVVTVRVASGQNAQGGGRGPAQIAVTDRGPGIPAEFRDRVFEKFFRVEHHVGHRGESVRGTGIGLYLCREIVRAHGGSIVCAPGDSGSGTRVAISLPAIG